MICHCCQQPLTRSREAIWHYRGEPVCRSCAGDLLTDPDARLSDE